jgi:hypothetical protein
MGWILAHVFWLVKSEVARGAGRVDLTGQEPLRFGAGAREGAARHLGPDYGHMEAGRPGDPGGCTQPPRGAWEV